MVLILDCLRRLRDPMKTEPLAGLRFHGYQWPIVR